MNESYPDKKEDAKPFGVSGKVTVNRVTLKVAKLTEQKGQLAGLTQFVLFYQFEEVFLIGFADRNVLVSNPDMFSFHVSNFLRCDKPRFVNSAETGFPEHFLNPPRIHQRHDLSFLGTDNIQGQRFIVDGNTINFHLFPKVQCAISP